MLIIASGQYITRIISHTLKKRILYTALFYYAGFLLFGFTYSTLYHFDNWLSMTVILYAVSYFVLIRLCTHEVAILHAQLRRVTRGGENASVRETLSAKENLYTVFLVMYCFKFCSELICHYLYVSNVKWFTVLIFFEGSKFVFWGSMIVAAQIYLMPALRSPFFYMIPSSHHFETVEQERTRSRADDIWDR